MIIFSHIVSLSYPILGLSGFRYDECVSCKIYAGDFISIADCYTAFPEKTVLNRGNARFKKSELQLPELSLLVDTVL